jgi:MFS family permease
VRATFAAAADDDTALWRATLSGVCANLVGIGLARFAYTPLIPALIIAGWFSPTDAAYLGAANLAGYLAGALLARPLASHMTPASLLRAAMLLTAASFPASAYPLSFAWFFAWRFAAGFGGGALMVVAAPVILRHVPVRQRGIVSGVMFAGVGLGIATSGTLVALLLRYGLVVTWNVLGVLALLLTAVAWNGWPQASERDVAAPLSEDSRARSGAALRALHIGYGLSAVGLVPPWCSWWISSRAPITWASKPAHDTGRCSDLPRSRGRCCSDRWPTASAFNRRSVPCSFSMPARWYCWRSRATRQRS